MITDEIHSNICKYVPARDLMNWRLVSKNFKDIADARLVGPCMLYKTNAELRAAKESVSLFAARELALALRDAQTRSGDIARFLCTLIPLIGFDRIQRIGEHYPDVCTFWDTRDRERPWRDLTPEECDDEYGIAVLAFINIPLVPGATLRLSFYPTFDLDEWSADIEIGNVRVRMPEQSMKEIQYGRNSISRIEPIHKFRGGDYLALVANVELVRLAFLHEGLGLLLPPPESSDLLGQRIFGIVGMNQGQIPLV